VIIYTSTSEESASLVLAARGRVQVLLGEQSVAVPLLLSGRKIAKNV
jgi:hypothetical protein